ncbi:hypothetical protein O181_027860 [Austropuccinia psidii MF-1]|uniref:Uncharacterized protein n=1 Tax=Austropuccinia psidii MF-1 TaxID=1389203 RepID=A0A9Q3CRR4_9BASI|nr:hypothetical protein [Austropuccinia psidii MF-1]
MVTFPGPNATVPNQGPKIQPPFRRRTFQLISLAIHGGNQNIIQGPQPPDSAGVGLEISLRIIPRAFSEVIPSFNKLSRNQVFQYSLDNSIGPYRNQSINLYVLGPIGPIYSSTVGIQSHSSISRWPELYWPNSNNTASDPPSMLSLSVFHINWPPFSSWGRFPQLINILIYYYLYFLLLYSS